jgi:signal transduction histidine kinase
VLGTLRQRLILSHVLPLLVIIPVIGITLIYLLETRVLMVDLASELSGDAALLAELTQGQPSVWTDTAQAAAFVAHMSQHLAARIMLLDRRGRLLASSDPGDVEGLGKPLDLPDLGSALGGQDIVRTAYSQHMQTEIIDVWSPVLGPDGGVIGVIRLSHRLDTVQENFLRLRYPILGVLGGGLVLGTAVGLMLALNLERPLQLVSQTIFRIAAERQLTPVAERGPREIRLLLRSVNTLVERLGALEQNRRQLLANLVHELGRPLGALQAAVEVLRGGADEDRALRQDLLAGMQEEIGRLRRLLDDLSGLHDQVLGTLKLERQPVVLDDWLLHLLAPWREVAQRKGLHWESAVPAGLPPLEADPDRLGQAVGNLLSNAIKFTPPEGTVSVKADLENGAVCIRVSDTGPGIPPEEQAHIFTPFFRGRAGGRFARGMGLGLSIARDLVAAHDGQLEVESIVGQGSCFTIRVPLAPSKGQL